LDLKQKYLDYRHVINIGRERAIRKCGILKDSFFNKHFKLSVKDGYVIFDKK